MILYLFVVILSTPHLLFTMNSSLESQRNQIALPANIIAHIVSQPDKEKIYKIIAIQEKINTQQNNDTRNKIEQPAQKISYEIQQALFPCFVFTQTCRTYYNTKKLISQLSTEILYTLFPQEIVPFLFPKPFPKELLQTMNATKEMNLVQSLLMLCANTRGPISRSEIWKAVQLPYSAIYNAISTDAFKKFLQENLITYEYIEKTKSHILRDTKTVIALFAETKHQQDKFFSFKIIAYPKPYQSIISSLVTLLIKISEIPGINNIIYVKNDDINSYTTMEAILLYLKNSIELVNKKLKEQHVIPLPEIDITKNFKNYFIIFNFLCSLPCVDLSLPAAGSDKNIAQTILDEFEKHGYPLTLFSDEVLQKLHNIAKKPRKSIYARGKENTFVIRALVNTYLNHIPKK